LGSELGTFGGDVGVGELLSSWLLVKFIRSLLFDQGVWVAADWWFGIVPRVTALIGLFQAGISRLQRLPASIARATIHTWKKEGVGLTRPDDMAPILQEIDADRCIRRLS